jgi:hypothetical protein
MQYKICRRCIFYVQAKAKVCHICGFTSFQELKKEPEKHDQIKSVVQRYAELARSLKKMASAAGNASLLEPPQRFSG